MNPTWTILIATIGRRADSFRRLTSNILDQIKPYEGLVTVTALWNNGERPLSHVRQALIDDATSTYVSFVDDDDELPTYHVSRVVEGLLLDVDYVGWRMQCYRDGVALQPTFHSLRYRRWYNDRDGYYRDVSHLNPVKRELALRCNFRRTRPPEDVAWADQLRPHVKTEHYVADVMYHYHSSSTDSTWQPGTVRPEGHERVTISDPNFSYHAWSFTYDEVST